MLKRIGSYLRANHLAVVALFIALGGGAYAAATIGPGDIRKNAVRAKHVKKNAIRAPDIKRNAVRGSEVRNGSLAARELRGVDLLESSGRIALSVSQDVQRVEDVLVSVGGELSIDVECEQDLAETHARFVLDDPVPPFETLVVDDDELFGATGVDPVEFGVASTVLPVDHAAGGFSVVAPSGDVVQGVFLAAVNKQGEDCVFAIQALG